jgi:hypothetical protein
MNPQRYQNGALWDWWAGRQITAEFTAGYSRLATQHLIMVARDWASHPGKVREWESPRLERSGAEQRYAGAASVVGQAVVEGLFGVQLQGREVRLAPRLGERAGSVRVYEPSTDLYVAYTYQPGPNRVTLTYGTNSPTALSVRLPRLWRGEALARLDGKDPLPAVAEQTGQDAVLRLVVPSGTHTIELVRLRSARRAAF